MTRVLRLLAFLALAAAAQWNAPQIGTFAVATLRDEAVASRLRERFKAAGSPVFLIGNPGAGLQQGDLIRFPGKAVLVDADVWQTLAADGALKALRQAPLVRVKAGADPAAWAARSRLISDHREKRLYEFGASLLRTLETAAGNLPDGQKLFLSFEGGQMVVTAPSTFMDRLRAGTAAVASPKEAPSPRGKPLWVVPPPPESLAVGARVGWTAWAVDDSGGPTADYSYTIGGELPAGLAWDPVARRIEGLLARPGRWKTVLRVQDGRGRTDTLPWNPVVDSLRPPPTASASDSDVSVSGLDLPWDTLTASRWSTWNLGEQAVRWEKRGIRLDSVTSDLSEIGWNGRNLSIRPRHEGMATFVFHLVRRGKAVQWSRNCPVRPHPLPVFLSRGGGSFALEGRTRTYAPVARDAYGGPVSLEADFPLDAPFDWDGRELRFAPRGPGAWSVKFTARDTLDHVAEQWVSFVSEARLTSRWSVESRWVAGTNSWTVQGEFGRGRIALFTPHPERLFQWDKPLRQDWPFLLLGANLLGGDAIRRGHALSIDIGGTLRFPHSAVLTGGVSGRLQGRYDARPALPWVFEGEFEGWVHQAILATDTSRLVDLLDLDREEALLRNRLTARFGPALGQVVDDAFDSHNAIFLSRLEGWIPLPVSLAWGIGVWREDRPVRKIMLQRLSTGIRWAPRGRWGALEATVRGGWGPVNAGFAAWGDLKWSSGILP